MKEGGKNQAGRTEGRKGKSQDFGGYLLYVRKLRGKGREVRREREGKRGEKRKGKATKGKGTMDTRGEMENERVIHC